MAVLVLLIAGLGAGCSTVGYYSQAVSGHVDLTLRRTSIDKLVDDPDTDPALRERLESVQDIRAFAIDELDLPDSGSYTDFADLERDVTVWLVTAAPELSLEAYRWCYPFVGCLSYRGYFKRAAARQLAEDLEADGYETALSPAIAYSTLGFMDDPVLNTMLAYDDLELAGLIFHELAHELVFVRGDARFNESFASAVEKLGKARYAQARALQVDPDAAARSAAREADFLALLLATRAALDEIYRSEDPDDRKRERKAAALAALQGEQAGFKARWDGYAGYDHWFAPEPPNNARLALLSTYQLDVAAFEALFAASGGDFAAFYVAVEALADLPEDERRARLDALAPP
ncbi:MAG: aminopeptidase [Pseudomonadota bacterium]